MNSIREIKSSIYKTECKKYIMEGMWLSDPIPTTDGNGVIDNYFVYSRNIEGSMVNGPYVTFGIYTEQNKSAYINDKISGQIARENIIAGNTDLFVQYEKDFLQVRQWVMKEIDSEKKNILNRYIENFTKLGGTGILEICREAVPSFFEWADKYK